MIYTLTLNPSIDYTAQVANWDKGKVNRSFDERCYPGGKGINVSVVLSALGTPSVALGFVGGFTGKEIVRLLNKQNINCDFVEVDGDSRINVKILGKSETQINGAGPFVSEGALKSLFEKLDNIQSGDYLVMAGSVPSCISKDFYQEVMARLKDKGIQFVVDATKDLLLNTLKYNPFLIKPNNEELAELFNTQINSVDDVILYGKKLQQMGARNVIVSMGGYGAVLISEKGETKYVSSPSGKVVNTVGAGDSLVAGFISEYEKTGDYIRSFYRGLATGSATAFSQTLATGEESDALFNSMYKF